jgi:hypothetical protein
MVTEHSLTLMTPQQLRERLKGLEAEPPLTVALVSTCKANGIIAQGLV